MSSPACLSCEPGSRVSKRNQRQCHECGGGLCADHVFIRVDESNASITRNSPHYCEPCADRIEPR